MTGQTYHQLTVLSEVPHPGPRRVLCQCSCGALTTTLLTCLKSGKTKSCGCRRASNMRRVALRHGFSTHPLYTRWTNMLARCSDPRHNRYHCYGARGVRVCSRWFSFENYLEDVLPTYTPGLTLDRVDNDGNYSPDNFRWATPRAQARNKQIPAVSESDIAGMRELYLNSRLSQREVAEQFGHSRELAKHYLRNLRAR